MDDEERLSNSGEMGSCPHSPRNTAVYYAVAPVSAFNASDQMSKDLHSYSTAYTRHALQYHNQGTAGGSAQRRAQWGEQVLAWGLYLLLTPFRTRTWAIVVFFLIVAPPCALLMTSAAALLTALSLVCFIIYPLGLYLSIANAYAVRGFGNAEMLLTRVFLVRVPGRAVSESPTACLALERPLSVGFFSASWALMEALYSDSYTWSCLAFFLFVKLPLAAVTFVVTLVSIALPLLMIANPLLLLLCPDCYSRSSWLSSASSAWVFDSYSGAAFTVPVGLCSLIIGTNVIVALGAGHLRLSQHTLVSHLGRRGYAPLL